MNASELMTKQHLIELDAILSCFEEAGMKLKPNKCQFGVKTVELIVHEVSLAGLRPLVGHVKEITDLEEPSNETEILRILDS